MRPPIAASASPLLLAACGAPKDQAGQPDSTSAPAQVAMAEGSSMPESVIHDAGRGQIAIPLFDANRVTVWSVGC